jgi:hypothetical protein
MWLCGEVCLSGAGNCIDCVGEGGVDDAIHSPMRTGSYDVLEGSIDEDINSPAGGKIMPWEKASKTTAIT